MRFKLYIPFALLVMLAYACNTNNPVLAPHESIIKSETKWLVDNKTESRLYTISYKEYDRQQRLIKAEDYNDSGIIKQSVTLTYKTNLRLEHVTTFNNGIEQNVTHNLYTLNSTGKIIERISQSYIGDTINIIRYAYDFKGNITEESTFDKNGIMTGKTTFEYLYNTQGFVIGRFVVDGPLEDFHSKDTIIYKTDNRVIERFTYNSLGSLEVIYTYYYDLSGNVIKEVLTDRNGNIIKKYKYEYSYF